MPERFVLDLVPADTYAEAESIARKQIDIGGLPCHECGLALRQDEYSGGEPDALGDAREVAEHDERIVERIKFGVRTGK